MFTSGLYMCTYLMNTYINKEIKKIDSYNRKVIAKSEKKYSKQIQKYLWHDSPQCLSYQQAVQF